MSVTNFEELKGHHRHQIEVTLYGNPPVNAAIECVDCGEVLLSFDKEDSGETFHCHKCGKIVYTGDVIWALESGMISYKHGYPWCKVCAPFDQEQLAMLITCINAGINQNMVNLRGKLEAFQLERILQSRMDKINKDENDVENN